MQQETSKEATFPKCSAKLGIQQGPIDFGMSRPHLVGRVFTSVKTLPGWYPKIAGNPWYRMLIPPKYRNLQNSINNLTHLDPSPSNP
jgi:hypothetical protein